MYAKEVLLAALLCVQALQLAGSTFNQAKPVNVIDSSDSFSIESVAAAICLPSYDDATLISRVTTIGKLIEYFDQEVTSEEHDLYDCKQRNMAALDLLHEVLTESNQNVCSDQKLDAIEHFYERFVSTHKDIVNYRLEESLELAHPMLRLFFHHYVMEVEITCKKSLISNIEWDLKDKFGDDISKKLLELTGTNKDDQSEVEDTLVGSLKKFSNLLAVHKYDDPLMVWELILTALSNIMPDKDAIGDEYDPITGEPIRLFLKVQSARTLNLIKNTCHYSFKPIYEQLIMPAIRLSNLGYSTPAEELEVELGELGNNELVKRWYSLTQLCEAVLPVKFYEDPSLEPKQLILISKEEAMQRDQMAASDCNGPAEPRQPIEYEPDTNSLAHLDKIESVESETYRKLAANMQTNLKARARFTTSTFVRLTKIAHKMIKEWVSLSVSEKATKLANPKSSEKENVFVQKELGEELGKELNSYSEQDLLRMNGASRPMKSRANAQGIGVRRQMTRGSRPLPQSIEVHRYAKTWSEIFSGLTEILKALAPTRIQILWVGGLILLVLAMIACLAVFATFGASFLG